MQQAVDLLEIEVLSYYPCNQDPNGKGSTICFFMRELSWAAGYDFTFPLISRLYQC